MSCGVKPLLITAALFAILAAPAGPATDINIAGDPDEILSDGKTYAFGPDTPGFRVSGDRWEVGASVAPEEGQTWGFGFRAPVGSTIARGRVFTGALRAGFNDAAPGMSVSLEHGCNELVGTFWVDEATFEHERLKTLSLRFEQHCEKLGPALRGTIRYHAGEPSAPSPQPMTWDMIQYNNTKNRVPLAFAALKRAGFGAAARGPLAGALSEVNVRVRQLEAVSAKGPGYASTLRDWRRVRSSLRSARSALRAGK